MQIQNTPIVIIIVLSYKVYVFFYAYYVGGGQRFLARSQKVDETFMIILIHMYIHTFINSNDR